MKYLPQSADSTTKMQKKLNIKQVRPNEDSNFTTNSNLLYCGTLLLKLAAMIEEAGVALANHHLSSLKPHICTTPCAGWVSRRYAGRRWTRSSRIISTRSLLEIYQRLLRPCGRARFIVSGRRLTQGCCLTQDDLTRNRRGRCTARLSRVPSCNSSSPKEPLEKTLHQLEEQIQTKEQSLATHDKSNLQVPQKKGTNSQRQLSPLQFMSKLERYIPTVLPDMGIDYITLTKTCNKLLKDIRAALQTELGQRYETSQTPGDSNDRGLAFMVSGILDDNWRWESSVRRGGPQLQVTRERFEEFGGKVIDVQLHWPGRYK